MVELFYTSYISKDLVYITRYFVLKLVRGGLIYLILFCKGEYTCTFVSQRGVVDKPTSLVSRGP